MAHILVALLLLNFMKQVDSQTVIKKRSELGNAVKNLVVKTCGNVTISNKDKAYFRYLELSIRNKSHFYVGAMNYLFQVETADMTCKKCIYKPPSEESKRLCAFQGKNLTPDCQNHIRVVLEYENELQVCSTGAYAPKLFKVNPDTLNNVTELGSGVAMCPFDPLDNYTAIFIRNGNPENASVPYFGTYSDFLKNYPVIFRPQFKDSQNRTFSDKSTDMEDFNFLNSPQFVGSFDVGAAVYVFFREIAIEYPLSKTKIYSRVGKVCKKDFGGGYMDIARKKWLSFQKARLICSLPGIDPYDFDMLYDVDMVGNRFYASFYKMGADLSASALCVYDVSSIEEAFKGKFKHQTNGIWETTDPTPRLDNCDVIEKNQDLLKDMVSQYQLMDRAVSPNHDTPIYYKQGVQFTRLVVEEANNTEGVVSNIYAASSNGEIYSIFYKTFLNGALKMTELNAIYLPMDDNINPMYTVWDMKLTDSLLLLGTDYGVTSLDIDQCSVINKMAHCIGTIRCVWDCVSKSCVSFGNSSAVLSKVDYNMVTIKGIQQTAFDTCIDLIQQLGAVYHISKELSVALPIQKTFVETYSILWEKQSTKSTSMQSDLHILNNPRKYSLNKCGELVIRNLNTTDGGIYLAKNGDGALIANYTLVIKETVEEEMLDWKREFASWAETYKNWATCTNINTVYCH